MLFERETSTKTTSFMNNRQTQTATILSQHLHLPKT